MFCVAVFELFEFLSVQYNRNNLLFLHVEETVIFLLKHTSFWFVHFNSIPLVIKQRVIVLCSSSGHYELVTSTVFMKVQKFCFHV